MFGRIRSSIGRLSSSVNPELVATVKSGAKRGALIGGGVGGAVSVIGLLTSGVFAMKLGYALSGQGCDVPLKTEVLGAFVWTWHFKYVIPVAVITCGLAGAGMGARFNFYRWSAKRIGIIS